MSLESDIAALTAAITKHGELIAENTATMRELTGKVIPMQAPTPAAAVAAPVKAEKPKKEKPAAAPEPEPEAPAAEVEETPAAVEETPEPEAPAAAEEKVIDDSDPKKLRAELQEYLKTRIITSAGPEFKAAFAAELATLGFKKAIELPDNELKPFYEKALTW